ncbi:MAG: elongation factor G [Pseudomonadota bacterium]|nr:elongation factor G [Pseudomonadota bacterium]
MSGSRCAALVGPYLGGKTTLLESLLFTAGAIPRRGTVKDGNTVGDASNEARSRQMSTEISSGALDYLGEKWNLIDCTGSIELMQEYLNAMNVADMAVFVVEPTVDRATTLSPIFKALESRETPRMIFINKVDTLTAQIPDVVAAIRTVSSKPLLLREYPITDGEAVSGYIDLISRRAYKYVDGAESTEIEFPQGLSDEVEIARGEMLEILADFDDTILEKLLEDELPEVDEVYVKAAEAMQNGQLVPVYFGSAEKNHGIRRVLKALRHEAPQPIVRAESLGFSFDAEPTAQVFKTYHAQHSGKVSLARVWSGEIREGQTLGGIRIGGLHRLMGANVEKITKAVAGDVVGLGRMDGVRTGDVLTESGAEPDRSKWPETLNPVYSLAITPENRSDEVKLSTGLQRLQEEDPSLEFRQNDDTHQLVLSGQGDIHLQVALEKLKDKYNVATSSARPNVPYKETIKKTVTQHGRFKRQTGGHGMFGDVHVEIEPRPRGAGIKFANRIVGGAVPKQYIPAVEAGVKEFAAEGPLGFPVVDFSVTLTDGQFHAVDSNEMSFKLAARLAMSEGMPKCAPVLLEPIAKVGIDVPSEYTNKVHGLVSGRRGQILGFEARTGWAGWDSLFANMPETEIHDLIIELRSLTQGVGTYSAQFDHLQELSGRVADQIIAQRAESKEANRT